MAIAQIQAGHAPLASGMKPREPRRKVVIQARMRCDSAWTDVCIRDISSRGLLVQTAAPPPRGTYIEIFRGRHLIVGRVVWNKDRRFGIRTQDKMDVTAVIENSGDTQAEGASGDRRVALRPPLKSAAATAAEQLERSRRMSAMFQFGCIVICGAAAAVILAGVVGDVMSRPLEQISERLGPPS